MRLEIFDFIIKIKILIQHSKKGGSNSMLKFQLITKKNCTRCNLLREWLQEQNFEFIEWNVENREIVDKLLSDKMFLNKFDGPSSFNPDGVALPTPTIRIDETGEYYSKEIFGILNIRDDFIKKLLKIEVKN
jgi:hypothetical protein